MMAFTEQYDPIEYDHLGDVEKVAELVSEAEIESVGRLIAEHGYTEAVAVALAHRHFDLKHDEAMLETMPNARLRVSTPHLLVDIAAMGAYPAIFKYTKQGRWCPLAFGVDNLQIKHPFWNDANFLDQVGCHLVATGLHDKLLLTVRDETDDCHLGNNEVFAEFNHDRRSEVRLIGMSELVGQPFVKTTFAFDADGCIKKSELCISCHVQVCMKH